MRALSKFFVSLAIMAGVGLGSSASFSATLPEPKGEPILEISGNISIHNGNGTAQFDREMLEGLGLKEIVTTTPWHNGPVRFEGVPLTKLMEVVGAQGKTVKATALDDYTSSLPMEDFERHGVILALKKDGQYMAIRDKGPLFIIYPYDSKPELKSQMYYARSAWQLKQLAVQE